MNTKNTFQDIIWGVYPIRNSSEELLAGLNNQSLYQPHLQSFKTESRKREWLTVRTLLKELLKEEKEVVYTSTGKPYLSDHSHSISISHTKGYVAIALDKKHPIGIDIETISPRIKNIRSRFMSDAEEANLSPENEIIHLLLHWSAKESIFKALGEENVEFKTELHIQPFKPALGTLSTFSATETRTETNRSFFIHYFVHADYVLTFTQNQ